MKINMQKKVEEILLKYDITKDCDQYLLYYVWDYELKEVDYNSNSLINIDDVSLVKILSLWKAKKISHPSAIMRARRKVQEDHKETRGSLWEERHRQQEKVQQDLGDNI